MKLGAVIFVRHNNNINKLRLLPALCPAPRGQRTNPPRNRRSLNQSIFSELFYHYKLNIFNPLAPVVVLLHPLPPLSRPAPPTLIQTFLFNNKIVERERERERERYETRNKKKQYGRSEKIETCFILFWFIFYSDFELLCPAVKEQLEIDRSFNAASFPRHLFLKRKEKK